MSCRSNWDPNRFKLDHGLAQGAGSASRRKARMVQMTGAFFLRGPIPMAWLHEAAKLGVSSLGWLRLVASCWTEEVGHLPTFQSSSASVGR